jgi:hypothetical protein
VSDGRSITETSAFYYAAAQATNITPINGPVSGGTSVKITGTNFSSGYSQAAHIVGTNTALSNYQVAIPLNTASLIASGKMRSDCGDLRVKDTDASTDISYWFKTTECNTTSTKIWVKIANLAVNDYKTLYLTYGNPGLTTTSNGFNVFDYFDDFNDPAWTASHWTATGTGYSVVNGRLYHGNATEPSNSFATDTLNNSASFTDGIIESDMQPTSCGNSYGKSIAARYTNDNNMYIAGLEAWTGNDTHIGKRVGGTWTNIGQVALSCSTSTVYNTKWTLVGSSQTFIIGGVTTSGTDTSLASGKVGVETDNNEYSTGAYWDNFRVRKYTAIEPTVILDAATGLSAPTVTFGGVAGTVTSVLPTSITVTTPAHTTGSVDVVVTNGDGQILSMAGSFTYRSAPTLLSVTPSVGLTSGGNTVTLSGTDFFGTPTVTFGGSPATVTYANSSIMSIIVPAHTLGTVDIVVKNLDGQTSILKGAYLYTVQPPSVSKISPKFGPSGGGTSVTINGSNFNSLYRVPITVKNPSATSNKLSS